MNSTDERLQLPPPPECRACIHLDSDTTLGVARNRCKKGWPMHAGCSEHSPVTPSIDTATTREPE